MTTPITPRGIEINVAAARPIEAVKLSRQMLRTTRVALFASLDPSGWPHATATNLAIEPDGTPLVFMAGLAVHARNVLADPRVSLVLADTQSDVMTTPRLTLSGRVQRVAREEMEPAKALYGARFPKSKLYLSLPDTLLFRVKVEALQLNGGPAQNANDVTPADLVTDLTGAGALMAEAPALIAALNAGEAPKRLALAAGAESGRWQIAGIDPEGVDLVASGRLARFWLPGERALDRAGFEAALAPVLAGHAESLAP